MPIEGENLWAGKQSSFFLDEEQYKTLKMWENSGKTEQRLSERAKRVILLSSQGEETAEGYIWRDWVKLAELFKIAFTVSGEGIEGSKDKRAGVDLQ